MRIYREIEHISDYTMVCTDKHQAAWLEPIEITEEIRSLYKVIKIAEEERFSCGVDDDPDVFNAYILLRKLTGIDGDLSKLKGE